MDSTQALIANRYRELIQTGRLKPGEQLPTIRDVAATMKVSITPIREAYQLLQQEGLIYVRHGVGVFVGSWQAPAPDCLDIGVLFRQTGSWREDDNYGLELFLGIQGALAAGGHRTLLTTLPAVQDAVFVEQTTQRLLAAVPHGMVLDERVPDDMIERLAASGRPMVLVGRSSPNSRVSNVCAATQEAGEAAAREFLTQSHRVAACLWRTTYNGRLAAETFLRVMAEQGRAVAPRHVAIADMVRDSRETTYSIFNGIISHPPVPTAVFCTDDYIASAFCTWAQDRGLRIPQDISVVGVLDLALAATMRTPLSTFRFNPGEIGKAAVGEVIARCRDPQRVSGAIDISGSWVARETVASLDAIGRVTESVLKI